MLNGYFNITTITEWAGLVAAILLLNKRTGLWRLLTVLLALTVCVEAIGWYMNYKLKMPSNALPFNLLLLLSVFTFIYLLGTAPVFAKRPKLVPSLLAVMGVGGLINLFFGQGLMQYNSLTELAGDLTMAGLSCYFFFRVLFQEGYVRLLHDAYFWLANGLLFCSLGSMLLYFFITALTIYYQHTGINIYGYINYLSNILLYASLIIAMLCKNRTTKL